MTAVVVIIAIDLLIRVVLDARVKFSVQALLLLYIQIGVVVETGKVKVFLGEGKLAEWGDLTFRCVFLLHSRTFGVFI